MASPSSVQLYSMLHRLTRQMHRFYHTSEHKHGLYHGQSHLLQTIAKGDGIVQRDLAELIDMRPPSITEAIGRMEELHYIWRKQDEKDQRLMHIYLTDKGKEIVKDTVLAEQKFADTLFEGLTEEEIETMLSITSKLCNSLNRLDWEEPRECEGKSQERHHHHGEKLCPQSFE